MKMCFSFVHKNINQLSVSNDFRLWTQLFVPWGLKAFTATSSHICLIFYIFQQHKEFFLDNGLVYSASICKYNKTPTEKITEVFCQFVSAALCKRHSQPWQKEYSYMSLRILPAYQNLYQFIFFKISAHSYDRNFVT